jgi:glutaconate CoA-transferase subunit A
MSEHDKRMSMSEAVDRFVHDGDVLHLGGFIQHEPYAAAHEIIRQGKKDLTLSKCAGVTVSDQMVGAGAVKHLITTFTWNPLPATAHCFVRAMTRGIPRTIELEEYSIFTLNLALFAGAMGLPYVASKSVMGSGFDAQQTRSGARNRLRFETSPFTGERVCLVPPIRHDVGIVQVQRCDPCGNAQAWGMMGETRYGMQSCDRIVVCAEEIVDTDIIMRDPNRTLVPAFRVCAVVEEPWGAHPQPVTGCYDIDWLYLAYYERETRTREQFEAFLNRWVYGVAGRREYLDLLGRERLETLRPEPFASGAVPYGRFPRHFEVQHG